MRGCSSIPKDASPRTFRPGQPRTSRGSPKITDAAPAPLKEERVLTPKWKKRGPIHRQTASEIGTHTTNTSQASNPAAVAKQRLTRAKGTYGGPTTAYPGRPQMRDQRRDGTGRATPRHAKARSRRHRNTGKERTPPLPRQVHEVPERPGTDARAPGPWRQNAWRFFRRSSPIRQHSGLQKFCSLSAQVAGHAASAEGSGRPDTECWAAGQTSLGKGAKLPGGLPCSHSDVGVFFWFCFCFFSSFRDLESEAPADLL